ncbi:hypothetical protein N8Z76_00305 [Gammaproteobacteria bacterium]|nr:hypothetical protein [Gammaproteobacteria bacterium]
MAFDYTTTVASALRLITKFGQTVTVNRLSGAYSPTAGTIGSGNSSYTAVVVTVPASSNPNSLDDSLKEDLTKGRLRFFLMAASGLSVVPTSGDRVEFESKEWETFGVTPLNPGGTAIMYFVGAREGGATT